MNVLIIGAGAREHTIAWKLRQSPRLDDLFAAPGNPGTAELGSNLPLDIEDFDAIIRACREHRIDLVVVGNEGPLAAGLVDRLTVLGIAAFGPAQAAAEIESSKVFAKELMTAHDIRTAPFATFDDIAAAQAYVEEQSVPLVVKADGLAVGKGVIVTSSKEQALAALDTIMSKRAFGVAGERVVIERRLYGREVSAHAFTDGQTVVHMPFACDHKPVFDGDKGPNTGGMGAYSPAGWLDGATAEAIQSGVTEAAVRAMMAEGRPYRGVLYPGLMVTNDGPQVIEFNCRFGDPEAQVLLPRMESDLLEVLWAVANNRLAETDVRWSPDACVGVVLASGGYPTAYDTGFPIEGLDEIDPDVLIFHAGTQREDDGTLVTTGGRVLTVAATGATLNEAREKAYRNAERIRFQGRHYRQDIGVAQSAAVQGA